MSQVHLNLMYLILDSSSSSLAHLCLSLCVCFGCDLCACGLDQRFEEMIVNENHIAMVRR